jgi:hypothetical protein
MILREDYSFRSRGESTTLLTLAARHSAACGSAHGDGKDSFVIATDEASGKTLWTVNVFHTRINFWRGEEDNPWLFISDLELGENFLLVRDEKNRCYSVYLNTRRVKKVRCGSDFSPQEARR